MEPLLLYRYGSGVPPHGFYLDGNQSLVKWLTPSKWTDEPKIKYRCLFPSFFCFADHLEILCLKLELLLRSDRMFQYSSASPAS